MCSNRIRWNKKAPPHLALCVDAGAYCVEVGDVFVGGADGVCQRAKLDRAHGGGRQHGREEEKVAGGHEDDLKVVGVDDLDDAVRPPATAAHEDDGLFRLELVSPAPPAHHLVEDGAGRERQQEAVEVACNVLGTVHCLVKDLCQKGRLGSWCWDGRGLGWRGCGRGCGRGGLFRGFLGGFRRCTQHESSWWACSA